MSCAYRLRICVFAVFLIAAILPAVTDAGIPQAVRIVLRVLRRTARIPRPPIVTRPIPVPKPRPVPRRPPRPPTRPVKPSIEAARDRAHLSADKAQAASRAALRTIESGTQGTVYQGVHTARILTRIWQDNHDRITAARDKLRDPDLSEEEIDSIESDLDSRRKEQQKIQELSQKYG